MSEPKTVLVIDVDNEWDKFHKYILSKSKLTAESAKEDAEYNKFIDSIKSKFIQLITLLDASILDKPADMELLRKKVYTAMVENHNKGEKDAKSNVIIEFAQAQIA